MNRDPNIAPYLNFLFRSLFTLSRISSDCQEDLEEEEEQSIGHWLKELEWGVELQSVSSEEGLYW